MTIRSSYCSTNEEENTLRTDTSSSNTRRKKDHRRRQRRRNRQKKSDTSVSTHASTSCASINLEVSASMREYSFRTMSGDKLLEFSINRLRTKLLKTSHLIGRETELCEMDEAFDHVSTNRQTSVVWITGASGTGKSHLANQLNIAHHPYHSCRRRRQPKHDRRSLSNLSINSEDESRPNSTKSIRPKRGRFFFSVTSKFDLQFVNEPLACIKFAMTDLANQILMLPRKKSPNDKRTAADNNIDESNHSSAGSTISRSSDADGNHYYFDDMQQKLRSGLGQDLLKLLSSFIPNLVDILDDDAAILYQQKGDDDQYSNKPTVSDRGLFSDENGGNKNEHNENDCTDSSLQYVQVSSTNTGYKELSDRMKFAFQRFLQIVTAYCPLVWIADDLQWADQASLDLIRTWVLDVRITSFMVIGCYRRSNGNNANAQQPDLGATTSDHEEKLTDDRYVHNNDILDETVHAIQQIHEERNIKVAHIHVDNLSLAHVNELLSRSLSESSEKTHPLAKVVYRKTHGNIFFTIQLLLNLAQQSLLRFDIVSLEWEWDDEDEIQGLVSASANVIELMKSKLIRIPEVRLSLSLAACLGANFSWNTLKVVLDGFQKNNEAWRLYRTSVSGKHQNGEDQNDLEQALLKPDTIYTHDIMNVCVEQGLLESRGGTGGTYFFVHDKVQEAALALIPHDKLSEVQYRIGEILFTALPEEELDQNCFLVTNLINPRLDMITTTLCDETSSCWSLVRLNYLAGTKAVGQSAFLSGLAYFGTAIRLLPSDHWREQHKLSLDLFSSAAECASVIGDAEKMEFYCSRLLDLKDHHLSVLEKVRVYHVLIDSHMNEADATKMSTESADLCLKVLDELGCSFPTSMLVLGVRTIRGIFKAKKDVQRGWIQETTKRLPICTDPEVSVMVKTLSRFFMIAYTCKPMLIPLAIVKSVRISCERGVTAYSAPAFASLAMIIGCFMGDFQTGENLALHALQLVSKLRNTSRVAEAEAIVTAYSTVLHWTKPLQSCRVPFLEAYQIGMRMGDTLSALWAALFYCEFSIGVGASLALVEAEALSFAKVAEDNGCTSQRDILCLHRKVAMKLQGKSQDTIRLDIEDTLNRYILSGNKVVQMIMRRNSLTTMIFFGAFEECADVVVEHGAEILEKLVGQVSCLFVAFYGGLCCYIASRSTPTSSSAGGDGGRKSRRQLLAKADFFRKRLKTWAKKGNPNCHHMISLLEAERLASVRRTTTTNRAKVIQAFEEAILIAGRMGIIQDQALANERMAEYYFRQSQDKRQKKQEGDVVEYIDEAMYRFGEAKRLYKEWGAEAVVEKVEQRCSSLLIN